VKRTMWQEVPWEGFDIGDWVEVLSRGLLNEPRTGVIREMQWEPRARSIRYYIEENGKPLPNAYAVADLKHVEPPAPRSEVVIEPPADDDSGS
jgi:hypothetical protein